ncbi:MAG TPA: Mur ligase domain-containing protein [Candidatus Saccharibacteria bacterium]|nr:Mur ligase domain-containing protein [Candidatus Saccharibacteria bacterium]
MNIYFSGIGGVGIGPLAEIAHDAGHNVIGSDNEESLMTKELRKRGVNISNTQDGSFLMANHHDRPIDWFIYTSALPEDHSELVLAKKLGIHIAKRDELLNYIISEKELKLIAIAGTHGKTTTTGMMIWTFKKLDIPVSYSIGTTIKFGSSGKFDPNSEYLIYECDEFDRNFLNFSPFISLITSLDYDHPDTYPTKKEYLEAFRQFATQSQHIITWDNQHAELYKDMPQVKIIDSKNSNDNLKLIGEHNRRNATLVQEALWEIGIETSTDEILSKFPGTGRRFEKMVENIYSDYGHHPTEIEATLQLASELSKHVVLVYQPHQNIRQHELQHEYTDQFEKAEKIYWLPTYLARENPNLPILKPKDLIVNITNNDKVIISDFNDELWNAIENDRKKGKLIIFMGAGEVDNWLRKKLSIK